jgi:hypothetical protein
VEGCAGGFGAGAFGATPFGSGFTFAADEARQVALNAADVTFVGQPAASDPATYWDALNPANWVLSVRLPASAAVRLVQFVERRDVRTVRVFFDGPLSSPAVYRLTVAPQVEDAMGRPVAQACRDLDFHTFAPFRLNPLAALPREAPTDLMNPWQIRDAEFTDPPPLGTFQIDDRGDLALETGRAYLRKRIFRRATTGLGEFFHLPGYGFAEPLKSRITPDLLRRMQARAQAQIAREPDVIAVQVQASVLPTAPGVVVLDIKATDRVGNVEEMSVPVRVFG